MPKGNGRACKRTTSQEGIDNTLGVIDMPFLIRYASQIFRMRENSPHSFPYLCSFNYVMRCRLRLSTAMSKYKDNHKLESVIICRNWGLRRNERMSYYSKTSFLDLSSILSQWTFLCSPIYSPFSSVFIRYYFSWYFFTLGGVMPTETRSGPGRDLVLDAQNLA